MTDKDRDQNIAAIAHQLIEDESFTEKLASRLDVDAIGRGVATDKAFTEEMARQLDVGAFGERIATDPTFVDAFTANMTRELDTRAIEREDRRYSRARIAMSAVGLLGFVGLGGAVGVFIDVAARRVITDERSDIVLAVKEEAEVEFYNRLAKEADGLRKEIATVGARITKNRTELIDNLQDSLNEMRSAFDLFVLEQIATRLDEASRFSAVERDSVLSALRRFQGDSKLRDGPQLETVIGKASRAFYAANQQLALEEVDKLYSDIAARDPEVADIFITYYGEQLLGTIGAPGAWDTTYLDRLDFYGKAVRGRDFPELVLPYEILIEYIKAAKKRTNETAEMLRRLRDLTPGEEATAYLSMFKYTDTRFWQRVETEFGRAIAQIAFSFDEQHRDVLDERWGDEEVAEGLYQLAVQNEQINPLIYNAIVERLREISEALEGG